MNLVLADFELELVAINSFVAVVLIYSFNHLKRSGVRWLHFKVFSAIRV